MTRRRLILPLMVGLSLGDCGDPAGPRDGAVAISTSTEGEDPDSDGFHVAVDGSDSLALLPSGTTELHLSPGRHTLQLLGVAEHCSVAPGTSVEVDITAGQTTPVAFQVTCPGTSIRVSVTTGGLDPDQDGYVLAIDGVEALALDPTASSQVNVSPGRHTLELLGVAEQCSVTNGTVLEQDFVRGSTTAVAYDVDCPLTGARITVTTTNGDIDDAGYLIKADEAELGTVMPNGELLVRLQSGRRTLTLAGLPPNCRVDGPGSQTVTIGDKEIAPIEFAVVCIGGSRTIRIIILSDLDSDVPLGGYLPVQIILDGTVYDVRSRSGQTSTFDFGGLARGLHSLEVQFRYNGREWRQCQWHPLGSAHPISTVDADTTEVQVEIFSTAGCNFL